MATVKRTAGSILAIAVLAAPIVLLEASGAAPLSELSCPPGDPQPSTVILWAMTESGPKTAAGAVDEYLAVSNLSGVDSLSFKAVAQEPGTSDDSATSEVVMELSEDSATVAVAELERGPGETFYVSRFTSCYSFELQHTSETLQGA